MPWLPTATTRQFAEDGAIANWMVIGVGAESTGGLKGFPESPVSVRVDAWVNGIDRAESTGGLKVFPKSFQ
jgi:hypothetical protein